MEMPRGIAVELLSILDNAISLLFAELGPCPSFPTLVSVAIKSGQQA